MSDHRWDKESVTGLDNDAAERLRSVSDALDLLDDVILLTIKILKSEESDIEKLIRMLEMIESDGSGMQRSLLEIADLIETQNSDTID